MEKTYSIDEILLAVNEINIRSKQKPKIVAQGKKINYSSIPKNTLKLIEEAEKNKI